jgi:polar amino acid transport system ATP-binding protein
MAQFAGQDAFLMTTDEPTAISNVMVDIKGVHKRFGELEVLKGIDLQVAPGEVVCLLGPSGSGKTTLLRCINFLETYDAGDILVDGKLVGYRDHKGKRRHAPEKQVAELRADTAMVFQQFNLFPQMTALENVSLGPVRVRKLSRDQARARGMELLTRVGLADKANNHPIQLSGGQQQRVAIARALAMDPKVILFDEVTSALDPELVGEVLDVMKQLATSHGVTMIVVTHEIAFARDVASRVVFMDQGVVVEHGPANEVINNPRTERMQAFLSRFSQ